MGRQVTNAVTTAFDGFEVIERLESPTSGGSLLQQQPVSYKCLPVTVRASSPLGFMRLPCTEIYKGVSYSLLRIRTWKKWAKRPMTVTCFGGSQPTLHQMPHTQPMHHQHIYCITVDKPIYHNYLKFNTQSPLKP